MRERKKIVLRNTRQSIASSPRFVGAYGMTPQQIRDANRKIVANRSTRPATVVRPRESGRDLILNIPVATPCQSIEYPTPDWFRSTTEPLVSVIVPLYKSADVVRDLIRSWDLTTSVSWEIVFVDDACPMNSKIAVLEAWESRRNEHPGTVGKIVYNVDNRGYGAACNVGAAHASGKYLVFLNADTEVTPGWLEPICDKLEDERIGIVGNLQLKQGGIWDGTIDGAGSEWCWETKCFEHIGRHIHNGKRISRPMRPEEAPPDVLSEGPREMVTGCCFGIRSWLFSYIGGYNQNYRVGYWEDAEMSMVVRELGYDVVFTPDSVVYHKLSHTQSGSHAYADYNRRFFANRWVHSGRIDPLVKARRDQVPNVQNILIRRSGARGDVLVAAGVAKALKEKHPGARILFVTDCADVLQGHSHLHRILTFDEASDRLFDVFYDLDLVYEYRPGVNILDSYAESVGVKREQCEVCIATDPINVLDDYIVIHAGRTAWAGRDWEPHRFQELASRLRGIGHTVVCVGTSRDHLVPCDRDLRGITSIQQLAHVIQKAKLFVGIDSLPMHIAQTVGTPGFAFFGSIDPSLRIYHPNMQGITAKVPCLGCHHRKPAPSVVTTMCEMGDLRCVSGVSVDEMIDRIHEYIHNNDRYGTDD